MRKMAMTDNASMLSRRSLLAGSAAALGAGGLLARSALARAQDTQEPPPPPPENPARGNEPEKDFLPPGMPGEDYTPVVTPDGATLPWKIVDGVKVYHLIVEDVDHEFAPGLWAHCWGYNGRVHGPTIEAVEGD